MYDDCKKKLPKTRKVGTRRLSSNISSQNQRMYNDFKKAAQSLRKFTHFRSSISQAKINEFTITTKKLKKSKESRYTSALIADFRLKSTEDYIKAAIIEKKSA